VNLVDAEKAAKQAQEPGRRPPLAIGGAHAWITDIHHKLCASLPTPQSCEPAGSRKITIFESNHTPPSVTYRDTKYTKLAYPARPAISMLYYNHRHRVMEVDTTMRNGKIRRIKMAVPGSTTSTGDSGFNREWAHMLTSHMAAGHFYLAMATDFKDILATTSPNRGFYALSLYRAALYARYLRLIENDTELHATVCFVVPLLISQEVSTAAADLEMLRLCISSSDVS
jgi:hypothetical protein